KKLGHGIDYLYPHDYQNDWVPQQYLPNNLTQAEYFTPKGNSKAEERYKVTYKNLKDMQKKGLTKRSPKNP
ncbi:AAA family ATPase, partial [Lactobacillus acidophilus]|nr:recombinase RarA [Lactobacillus acidophilus]